MIDIRNSEYKWGWIDSDKQLLYASFNIFCNCVDKEDLINHCEWSDVKLDSGTLVIDEITDLYTWWKTGRAEEREVIENIWKKVKMPDALFTKKEDSSSYILTPLSEESSGHCKEATEAEYALVEKETNNLIRLMKIRSYLWT